VDKVKDWKQWLKNLGYPQTERAPRRNPSGLAAMHGTVLSPKLGQIKIISSTGLFLQTAERWPIGDVVSLSLQKEGALAHHSEFQIDVQARVASYGDDGVGMGFVLPKGLNSGLWEHLVDSADTPTETDDTRFIFRMVRAILFLYRVCPSKDMETINVLTGELDEFRTRNMISIVLEAEKMLAAEPNSEKMRSDPQIVETILKDGSWGNDHLTPRLWAGLLASSCSLEETDQSCKSFAELLVQMTPNQARILVEGCNRAKKLSWVERRGGPATVVITPEEMVGITGNYDLYRSATDVAYLNVHGLVEKNFDFSTYGPKETFDITPTSLGVELFHTCKGHLLTGVLVSS
jgi:hypothetical protein